MRWRHAEDFGWLKYFILKYMKKKEEIIWKLGCCVQLSCQRQLELAMSRISWRWVCRLGGCKAVDSFRDPYNVFLSLLLCLLQDKCWIWIKPFSCLNQLNRILFLKKSVTFEYLRWYHNVTPRDGWRTVWFILFLIVLIRYKIQIASSRIWSWVAESVPHKRFYILKNVSLRLVYALRLGWLVVLRNHIHEYGHVRNRHVMFITIHLERT